MKYNATPVLGPNTHSPPGTQEVNPGIPATGEPDGGEFTGAHKALLVDDNLALLEVAAILFEQYGFEALPARNGGRSNGATAPRPGG